MTEKEFLALSDREKDALVAEKVMGWTRYHDGAWVTGEHHEPSGWSPCNDIADAWQVSSKMADRMEHDNLFEWRGPNYKPTRYYLDTAFPIGTSCWYVTVEVDGCRSWHCANSPARAISLAALHVVGAIVARKS